MTFDQLVALAVLDVVDQTAVAKVTASWGIPAQLRINVSGAAVCARGAV